MEEENSKKNIKKIMKKIKIKSEFYKINKLIYSQNQPNIISKIYLNK